MSLDLPRKATDIYCHAARFITATNSAQKISLPHDSAGEIVAETWHSWRSCPVHISERRNLIGIVVMDETQNHEDVR